MRDLLLLDCCFAIRLVIVYSSFRSCLAICQRFLATYSSLLPNCRLKFPFCSPVSVFDSLDSSRAAYCLVCMFFQFLHDDHEDEEKIMIVMMTVMKKMIIMILMMMR